MRTLAVAALLTLTVGCNAGEALDGTTAPPVSPATIPPAAPAELPAEPPGRPAPGNPVNGDEEDTMGCDASKAEWMIGQQPTDELLRRGAADAGAKVSRYIRHDEMVTMEYHPSRLNVDLDENGVIRAVRCG